MTFASHEPAQAGITAVDVERALSQHRLRDTHVAALLSPAAVPYLETMARKAATLTRQRFGRTLQLYAPLYVSNECVNRCSYCGFSHQLAIPRVTLSVDAVVSEAEHLHQQGFRHLLLVSGEAPRTVTLEYLETITRAVRSRFASVAIETGTFDLHGYQRLIDVGVDSLALYQETYLPDVYARVHQAGPKRRFQARLTAMQHCGQLGFRSLGIGALLGLAPWRSEAARLIAHGRALTQSFWQSRIAVSFPRIRDNNAGFAPPHPVTDRDLVQLICATRLALPDAELVLSTREPAALRDHLMTLGITRMSAGSRTNPGGYGAAAAASEQFAVEDSRSAAEVARAIYDHGLEPLWKDFDHAFVQTTSAPAAS